MWTVIFLYDDCIISTVIMYYMVRASEHSWGQRQTSTVQQDNLHWMTENIIRKTCSTATLSLM